MRRIRSHRPQCRAEGGVEACDLLAHQIPAVKALARAQ